MLAEEMTQPRIATFLATVESREAQVEDGAEPSIRLGVSRLLQALRSGPASVPELLSVTKLQLGALVHDLNELAEVGLISWTSKDGDKAAELTSAGSKVVVSGG